MTGAAPDPLPDDEILTAVAAYLRLPDPSDRLRLAGAARIARQPLLACTVTRCVESRTESEQTRPAPHDLSDVPVYGDLGTYDPGPVKNVHRHTTVHLVHDGSARETGCTKCSHGRRQCANCGGRGRQPCPALQPCALCRGARPCTACEGKGTGRGAAVRPRAARKVKQPDVRTGCDLCGEQGTACPGCGGRGRILHEECGGSGEAECRTCRGNGTEECGVCEGKGRLTVWTRGTIERTPVTETVDPPPPHAPWLVRRRLRNRGAWRTHVLGDGDALPEELAEHHRRAVRERLARRKGEIAREVSLRHLPLARVELHELPGKVLHVYAGHTEPGVVALPSRRVVTRVSAAAAGCAAVVVLLLATLR
ncbi:hypothetical protein ACFTXJ_18625 [Streptomyces zhihengii]|uniref:hypothetical protein n=1 Tax=Streptomyces zhihengii TaxID=1818004 RepID=UPI0036402C10